MTHSLTDDDDLSEFSKFVNARLETLGWSKRELARRADVSPGLVSNQLSGYVKVSWKFCTKIAEPLGVSVWELRRLGGFGMQPPDDPKLVDILAIGHSLSPTKRELLWQYAKFLQQTDFSFEEKANDSQTSD